MINKQQYNVGVEEIFSNFSKDPCVDLICRTYCPVGFTCIPVVPPCSGEFRLDFSGCNIKCPFCWTLYNPLSLTVQDVYDRIRCRFDKFYSMNQKFNISYLRITGGEPILSEKRTNHMLELFNMIDREVTHSSVYSIWKSRKTPMNLRERKNIKIQTNGVRLSDYEDIFIGKLKDFKYLAFTFEVSLKDTNPDEYFLLSGMHDSAGFFEQIKTIRRLLVYEKQGYPLFVRGILGIYHSAQYDLLFPGNGRMMSDPHEEFRRIVRDLMNMPLKHERFYVEPIRFTQQMDVTERHCKDIGIVCRSKSGSGLKPRKKTPIQKTDLWESI